ncbi:MAG: prepilin-type N-terminal cleavage/methylation domain-containing protein [Coprothermobacterota bacterium]|nr:prepilin-type N-terminal cleavage/methylation domain-containing protein [Coprothermobacterota bacterium]
MKGQKGFTLIELIIVIAIIAILAAVAVPNYLAFRDRANISAAKDALGSLRTALEAYAADNGYYAPNDNTTDINYLAPNYIDDISKLTSSWASQTYDIDKTTYLVTVIAKDRHNTQLTLTPTGITP